MTTPDGPRPLSPEEMAQMRAVKASLDKCEEVRMRPLLPGRCPVHVPAHTRLLLDPNMSVADARAWIMKLRFAWHSDHYEQMGV